MDNMINEKKDLKSGSLLGADQLFFIFLTLVLISTLAARYLSYIPEMGEIWNYQYARRILYGQVPYLDFGMLQTPFSAQLNALFLYLFSDKLIVMRIVGAFIGFITGLTAYKIFRLLGKNIIMAFAYTILFVCPFFFYSHNNYSWYAILFLTIALLFEMVRVKTSRNILEIFIGIFLGLATISKQNIGAFGLLGSTLFLVYFTLSSYYGSTRENIKLLGKNLIIKIFSWSIVIGIEAVYLWRNGGLGVFVHNMLGITQFGRSCSISYVQMLIHEEMAFKILGLLVPIFVIAPFMKAVFTSINEIKKRQLILTGLYAIANFSMIFPIADSIHLVLAAPLLVIAISSCFDEKPVAVDIKKHNKFRNVLFLLILGLWLSIVFNVNYSSLKSQNTVKHFEYVPLNESAILQLKEVDDKILEEEQKGKTVYFLNYQADYYLIPLDKYSYRYDTVSAGSEGEDEIIRMLSISQNVDVIIRGEAMEPMRIETGLIEEYVRGNMQFVTSVRDFDIYTK